MSDKIESLNIKSLFSSSNYIIPIYQRNYAWGEREITQLIQDIVDVAKEKQESNYHIGTLVVYERNRGNSIVYETIDGQQRLTTLNIILSMIKREYSAEALNIKEWYSLNIEFDSRQISTETLQLISDDKEKIIYTDYKEYNHAIQQAYEDSKKSLKRILAENQNQLSFQAFYNYLIEKVFILRVPVPHDTDLNHYFEIMNSRGEQLEKHEILKSHFLKIFKNEKYLSYTFNKIWEACSDMERYVQYGFKSTERDALFTPNNWNTLTCSTFDEIPQKLNTASQNSNNEHIKNNPAHSINEIIKINSIFYTETEANEEEAARFSSVINFPNFLLHVLRIHTGENISLDDKRLLDSFTPFLTNTEKRTEEEVKIFAKNFGFNLLKCRLLFDNYIIKREFINDKDQWSLKKIKRQENKNTWYTNSFDGEISEDNNNKEILMLLAMFHVSNPTLVYKHWLNAALLFLFQNQNFSVNDYKNYLENLAKSFLSDRFLSSTPLDYHEIIYINNGIPNNKTINEALLHQGTSVENFVFNYLDWLLCKQKKLTMNFTFRSSVEHYYPQNPKEGNDRISNEYLHHFGNLCLISSSKNSALSNYMPTAKKEHYLKVKPDSIKQQLMMTEPNWGKDEIIEHGTAMIKVFQDEFS